MHSDMAIKHQDGHLVNIKWNLKRELRYFFSKWMLRSKRRGQVLWVLSLLADVFAQFYLTCAANDKDENLVTRQR